jgi:hypothetical protein
MIVLISFTDGNRHVLLARFKEEQAVDAFAQLYKLKVLVVQSGPDRPSAQLVDTSLDKLYALVLMSMSK